MLLTNSRASWFKRSICLWLKKANERHKTSKKVHTGPLRSSCGPVWIKKALWGPPRPSPLLPHPHLLQRERQWEWKRQRHWSNLWCPNHHSTALKIEISWLSTTAQIHWAGNDILRIHFTRADNNLCLKHVNSEDETEPDINLAFLFHSWHKKSGV